MAQQIREFPATDAQWAYVRRLMNEAFAKLYKDTPNIDVHHMPRNYTSAQASADIGRLLKAKAQDWK